MNNRRYIIHLITEIAILSALSIILSIIDKYISGYIFINIPNAKIGLANLIILVSLQHHKFYETFIITLLKSLIAGLLFSGLIAFMVGGTATIASFLFMYFAYKLLKDKVSIVGISLLGGFIHTVTQLLVISLLYNIGYVVISYAFALILISLVASTLIGILSIKLNNVYFDINFRRNVF